MMVYDLRCRGGHVFEAWFKDRESYLEQRRSARVECPSCGSSEVNIAFTGCSIQTRRPETAAAARDSAIERLRGFLEENFEDVGRRFAEEARLIHSGEAERRNIRGLTTEEEEKVLRKEGVAFLKLPVVKLDG